MPDKRPTHEQGQLQLQLYDLRREAKLRQARDWFSRTYFVDTFVLVLFDHGTPRGIARALQGPAAAL